MSHFIEVFNFPTQYCGQIAPLKLENVSGSTRLKKCSLDYCQSILLSGVNDAPLSTNEQITIEDGLWTFKCGDTYSGCNIVFTTGRLNFFKGGIDLLRIGFSFNLAVITGDNR